MCSARDNAALPTLGFPIRASAGHWPFSASPRLIAAVHALHRLLVPRHPPCALIILTVINCESTVWWTHGRRPKSPPGDTRFHWLLCSFQGPRGGATRRRSPPELVARGAAGGAPVSQNSTACSRLRAKRHGPAHQARSTFLVRMCRDRDRAALESLPRAQRSTLQAECLKDIRSLSVRELPRKEVIQPQLPLRLPCYDFTPVTSPTFDGSLPCGLGHRLRVLLTPVV